MDEEIVGISPAFQQVLALVRMIAKTDSVTLIQGETGTGKEVIASSIHNQSSRREGPFVKLNCAAIPGDLLESELFGHEKGAYTGALTQTKGRFQMADPGDALSRRDWGPAAGTATQTAPRFTGTGVRALRQHPDHPRRRARGGGHQPGPFAACDEQAVSRRPLLPIERHSD